MPRRRLRRTDFDVRVRNMLESQGAPAMAGVARVAGARTAPVGGTAPSTAGGAGVMVIDMGDSAVYTGWSKPYYPMVGVTLAQVVAIVTAGSDSGETQAQVYKNGTDILGILTVPVGATKSNTLDANTALGPDDFWQVLVAQAGVGASGLTFYGTPG